MTALARRSSSDIAPTDRAPLVFVSAGEPSGDDHAAVLVEAIRRREPKARFVGFGGEKLAAAGVELLEPLAANPVMGFAKVLPAIGGFMRLLNGADRWFARHRPDLLILIDYPGFNVRLAQLAKRRGVRVAYYICPQYWGWAPWRARRFAKAVDLGLTLMPFEPAFLARFGVDARHVGHPIAERLDGLAPADDSSRALALLPGSRGHEIELLLDWQLSAALEFGRRVGTLPPLVTTHPKPERRAQIAAIAAHRDVPLEVRSQPLTELLPECRAALVTSGTATLECALLRVPSVIVYRLNGLMQRAVPYLLTSPHIGLPNLLSDRRLFPEHLAARDPSAAIGADLESLWCDGPVRSATLAGLDALRAAIVKPGVADAAAEAILALVSGPPAA